MPLELEPFRNALRSLERGMVRHRLDPLDEELRDACIQRFEYCFELGNYTLEASYVNNDSPNLAKSINTC